MKKWSPLIFVVLLPVAFAINGSTPQGCKVYLQIEGDIEARVFGDLILNVSKVYDEDTIYLSIRNTASSVRRLFWRCNVNTSYYYVSAVWFITAEHIIERYGNVFHGINGSYWASESNEWFNELPTAGWMLWMEGEELWMGAGEKVNAHFTLHGVQPPEEPLKGFTLALIAW